MHNDHAPPDAVVRAGDARIAVAGHMAGEDGLEIEIALKQVANGEVLATGQILDQIFAQILAFRQFLDAQEATAIEPRHVG